jgi:asparagine synthase (glutamine-hydrolysing)
VALSGDGGDELFAGYDRFQALDRLRKFDRLPRTLRGFASLIADRLPYTAYGKNYLHMISRSSALERYFESNFAPWFLRQALLKEEWMLPANAAYLTRTLSEFLLPENADLLSQTLYFETTQNLPGDMLTKVDRMSMANSLEVRCPLLDHELGEMAAAIPPAGKIHAGQGKYILRRALQDRLPKQLLSRGKMGFAVPLPLWFRRPLRAFLHDHLTSAEFLGRNIVSPPFVRHMLDEHDSGRRDNSHWLWSLLMLELWFRAIGENSEAYGQTHANHISS